MSARRLVIVSSRLPLTFDAQTQTYLPSSGGLVSALKGVQWEGRVRWVGTYGKGATSSASPENVKDSFFDFHAVDVKEEIYTSYYDGFCNGVLWPLFHYQTERVHYELADWNSYVQVNESFCHAVLEVTSPSDLVWVHDYQLMLLPEMLKRARPHMQVGFFLHIPFPSSELYRQLPKRRELLQGVLAADLISFHDYSYLRHFCSAVFSVLGISSSLLSIPRAGGRVDLGVFPVSVGTQGLVKAAYAPETEGKLAEILSTRSSQERVILGVDRLDYSKGLGLKLKIFRKLLENHPELVGRVKLLKLVVPSRIGNAEYEKYKLRLEQEISEINALFSTPEYVPITYIFGSVELPELLALYRSSDVLLVTSQRDGMNLVSLEYLVVQDMARPGAVVLSEFAGAASTLSHAFKINPWDANGSAEILHQALLQPLEERRKAYAPMARFLENYTATAWASAFLERLKKGSSGPRKSSAQPVLKCWESLKGQLSQGGLTLLVDYDGVLSPIVDEPEKALPDPVVLEMLRQLRALGAQVIVVSGRSAPFLESVLGEEDFFLASNHGAKNFDPLLRRWISRGPQGVQPWYVKSRRIMRDFVRRTPGCFIEEKEYSLVWHNRARPLDFGTFQSRKLFEELESALSSYAVQVSSGKRIVEVKDSLANKGAFVRWLNSQEMIPPQDTVICLGDDLTDEDMFAELSFPHITVHVGEEPTKARYTLGEQEQVASFLEKVLEAFAKAPDRALASSLNV